MREPVLAAKSAISVKNFRLVFTACAAHKKMSFLWNFSHKFFE